MNNEVMTDQELKACLVKILDDVAKYCDDNGLKYILSSGTLLGAVRHKGFIPWDDDIDIYMPREDYEKLHVLVKEKPIGVNYKIESLFAGNSAYPFAKIIDTDTEIVNSRSEYMTSLWIDIFPVDGVTSEMANSSDEIHKKMFQKYMLFTKAANKLKNLDSIKQKFYTIIARLGGTAKQYGSRIEKYSKSHKMSDCPYAANIAWGGIKGYLDSKTYFEDRVLVEFEGKFYYTTQHWEEYLTKMYGDYMTLPPEDQRDTHNIIAKRKKK